ncbi:ABC transporter ATP-binding protein [Chitinasiproducens palmae]|uniref:Peptide/nickel transport system ATP-binding protein n=1 Tax=Chitinasiproducens palmae TaxID=1770053 RepID=A0A1H2PR64_9BURK|nr:ABC transporter ATP-binding protein [Chitinasiproducens palmae]SDV49393.1 peptide/nickel transport system ATP-binding protein [Chitinasiproducens palmae]
MSTRDIPSSTHAAAVATDAVLRLHNVSLRYDGPGGPGRPRATPVVRDVSLQLRPGESYGLVGESGCGKSTIALAIAGYLPRGGAVSAGEIHVAGKRLDQLDATGLRTLRREDVGLVYQDPARALNPALTVARQLHEVFALRGATTAQMPPLLREALAQVRIEAVDRVLASYPHELSGGMQQRVVIAMALAKRPRLLILDEPTTGLDATVEAEVLDLVGQLRRELGMATLLISHNLAVVARVCERVGVLYAGELVEEGPSAALFSSPRHPYTLALLRCLPGQAPRATRLATIPGQLPPPGSRPNGCVFTERCPIAAERCAVEAPRAYLIDARPQRRSRCHFHTRVATIPLVADAGPEPTHDGAATAEPAQAGPAAPAEAPVLRARALSKTYRVDGRPLKALDDVSLDLAAGETLGLVGESGSGKSTLARLVLGLVEADPGGAVELDGSPAHARVTRRTRAQSRYLQAVFQNPGEALNRAHTVRRLVGRALGKLGRVARAERPARVSALLDAVRLPRHWIDARSRQLSGGMQQRVAIARAFAGAPRVVVCDEPTSALDVSVQAAILNLLGDLQREHRTSYLFISHDLAVVRHVSDRVGVLYRGRLVELGPAEAVFTRPGHPYTRALLAAGTALTAPGANGGAAAADHDAAGCAFRERCPSATDARCANAAPVLRPWQDGQLVACHARDTAAAPGRVPDQAPGPGPTQGPTQEPTRGPNS